MLTKAIALERLRTTGTLGADKKGAFVLSLQQARCPLAASVSRLVLANARVHGARHMAPAASQAVLP